ncbi:hypothetical protein B5M09_011720 [Aphanomyces astaci]|uniref:Uncharacterized protein n=1 Tax=Aphanomyces astaci TaxID=112090 RepID=A0A425DIR2_APHAT|nr:hypothetical protein B5M09_011720 [Aphanomyces astaci]
MSRQCVRKIKSVPAELRPNTEVDGAGLQSYVAKKRRSLDKFIDGAADADNRASNAKTKPKKIELAAKKG